jgi:uncharacterized protein
MLQMKIWLDTSPIYSNGADCTSPCTLSTDLLFPLIEDDVQQVQTCTLEHAKPLFVQQCDYERWLVCNPIGVGHVIVLDSRAMLLFQQFQLPTTVSQVIHAVPGYSREVVEEIVALFFKSGFLQAINMPSLSKNKKNVEEAQILTAWLHVTNACNLRCHYCYIHKTSENMAEDTSLKAVDAIFRSAIKHGFKRVRLKYSGGEASLHMTRVIEIHDYAIQLAQRHAIALDGVIMTNGVALSQRAIDNLKLRNIEVMISLDGLGAYHDSQRTFKNGQGSFQYVARTIDRLLTNGITPHISITVSHRNLEGLPDLIAYVLKHEMPFGINYYRDNEHSASFQDLRFEEEEMITAMSGVFEAIEQSIPKTSLLGCLVDRADMSAPHRYTCNVGQSYLVINQIGGVAKCQADIKRTVTTIDVDDPLQAIRDDREGVQVLPVEEKEGCRTCEWRYWCTGGCSLLTYRATGRYDVKSPNCNIYKALFPKALRLEALRLLQYQSPLVFNLHQYENKNMKVVGI